MQSKENEPEEQTSVPPAATLMMLPDTSIEAVNSLQVVYWTSWRRGMANTWSSPSWWTWLHRYDLILFCARACVIENCSWASHTFSLNGFGFLLLSVVISQHIASALTAFPSTSPPSSLRRDSNHCVPLNCLKHLNAHQWPLEFLC